MAWVRVWSCENSTKKHSELIATVPVVAMAPFRVAFGSRSIVKARCSLLIAVHQVV
jgi:hypothetical protein